MNARATIKKYFANLPEAKRGEMDALHRLALRVSPGCQLSFSDGKDSTGKIISNPTIGYGLHTMHYADGTTKDVFQVGLSANATGISIYILGLTDKTYLPKTFGKTLGKASVTGYCIRFKALKDINIKVLEAALRFGLGKRTPQSPKSLSPKSPNPTPTSQKPASRKPAAAARKKVRTSSERKK